MSAISPADGPVAVTGASGYIGSWIVRDLMEQGDEVRACVRDQSKALAATAPEGAAISGDQAIEAVQEYLANHKLAFCKARANEPGWLTKYAPWKQYEPQPPSDHLGNAAVAIVETLV